MVVASRKQYNRTPTRVPLRSEWKVNNPLLSPAATVHPCCEVICTWLLSLTPQFREATGPDLGSFQFHTIKSEMLFDAACGRVTLTESVLIHTESLSNRATRQQG